MSVAALSYASHRHIGASVPRLVRASPGYGLAMSVITPGRNRNPFVTVMLLAAHLSSLRAVTSVRWRVHGVYAAVISILQHTGTSTYWADATGSSDGNSSFRTHTT